MVFHGAEQADGEKQRAQGGAGGLEDRPATDQDERADDHEATADAKEAGEDAGRQAQAEEEQDGHAVGLRVEGCPQV